MTTHIVDIAMWQAVRRLLNESLGDEKIRDKIKLPGGEIHSAWRIVYGKKTIFVKSNTREMLPIFTAEADQLELLARSNTVHVPKVYGIGNSRNNSFLLLEYQPISPLNAHSAYQLGQQLAHLHLWSEQPQFGLDFDNDLATTPQPNAWQRRWATFFSEKRIVWQIQLATEKGIHFGNIDEIVDIVSQKLQHHQPQPSLLHGDLWPENCAQTHGAPFLFDPACYWGDRECDLAMLPLYPHLPPQIYDGYQSVWPLDVGFIERQPLYQLYYLLNRSNLFGGQHTHAASLAINDLLTTHRA